MYFKELRKLVIINLLILSGYIPIRTEDEVYAISLTIKYDQSSVHYEETITTHLTSIEYHYVRAINHPHFQ